MQNHTVIFLVLCTFAAVFSKNSDVIDSNIVNSKVDRKIDISTHLVKTVSTITIENKGTTAVRTYLFSVSAALKDNLSFIGAMVSHTHCNHIVILITVASVG